MHVGLLPECVCVKVLDTLELKLQLLQLLLPHSTNTGNGAHPLKERTLILTADPSLQPIK